MLLNLLGFEAEAQRYAMLARRRKDKEAQAAAAAAGDAVAQAVINQEQAEDLEHDNWSYSSDDYRFVKKIGNRLSSKYSFLFSLTTCYPVDCIFTSQHG